MWVEPTLRLTAFIFCFMHHLQELLISFNSFHIHPAITHLKTKKLTDFLKLSRKNFFCGVDNRREKLFGQPRANLLLHTCKEKLRRKTVYSWWSLFWVLSCSSFFRKHLTYNFLSQPTFNLQSFLQRDILSRFCCSKQLFVSEYLHSTFSSLSWDFFQQFYSWAWIANYIIII